MNLSWNERRKMNRYEKQLQQDSAKRTKAAERERRRDEQVWAKQWKGYHKQQEKETKKWRKATTHPPELNHSDPYASTRLPGNADDHHHHHGMHLHSPHPHIGQQHATRPLPLPFVTNSGVYTAQCLPVDGAGAVGAGQPMVLPSLAAFGVVHGPVRAEGSIMSR
ncbi:hypothetical protein QFC20_005144 [Naganishia adeliensis]|uniref:Uncharacterized protein n=1 Tax=Naganishia adeliensis TaxID=92952 RepID=A0ACC2VRE1_9TREE|nr:hypothetical protein QFC20_005144 [Naganishia adeliensis]